MENISTPLHSIYVKADKPMLIVLWGLFPLALALSGMHDTWLWSLVIGLPTALVPTALIFLLPGALLTSLVVAAALIVFTALHNGALPRLNAPHGTKATSRPATGQKKLATVSSRDGKWAAF